MLSVFEVNPKITGIPTEPLRRAVLNLKEVAEAESARIRNEKENFRRELAQHSGNFRIKYYSVVLDPSPETISLATFKDKIVLMITQSFGKKGPTENAFNKLDDYAKRAEAAFYPLASEKLQRAFMNFLMILVTEGFSGEDTTGTQMGNFQGEWRGGGF